MTIEESLALSIPQIWTKLPALFKEDWAQVEHKLWALLGNMEAGELQASKSILELFAAYPDADAQLKSAMANPMIAQHKSAKPAGMVEMERHVVVPVFYGTDRKPKGNGYGSEPGDGSLSVGVARVSVPEDHRMGEIEHPPWWKLGFGWDPEKHIQLLSVEPFTYDQFVARARKTLEPAGRKEALVFIHGFNVDFGEAARRAAQLAYDLRFKGLAMMYSWSSKGIKSKKWYQVDSDKVDMTRPRLQEFLTMVMTDLGVDSVHVIAHSMGNRALTEVLKDIDLSCLPEHAASLRQIVFAAPDVNARTFQDLAAQFHHKAERCTLYASSEDWALKYSKNLNKSKRAGDSGGSLMWMEGVDTVDVTAVDTSFVGHSFYGDNTSVLSDLDVLIRHGHPPGDRPRLDPRGAVDREYWVFVP